MADILEKSDRYSDKVEVSDVENEKSITTSPPAVDASLAKRRARITRHIDIRLIPILGLMYAINGIDRTNLSVARIAGMDADLGTNIGDRYSIVLLIFFIPYFIFEIPSNLVIRKVGAARWLSFIAFSWGLVILGGAFCKTWTEMVGVRILLGVFEAGFFPGCLFLISCWYQRYQVQKRISWFYSVNLLAGGFGNLLAYGINQLDGKAGFRGWRWIFIIEGLIPIALAVVGYFVIVDFPDKVHEARRPFLTEEEVQIVKDGLEADRGDSEYDPVTLKKIVRILCQWQLWVYALLFMSCGTGIYAFAYFTALILRGMGHSTDMVFLLSAPPAITAIPYSYITSWLSDKYKLRAPFVAFQAITCITGLMLTAYHPSNSIRYFGVYLGMAGCNGNLPSVLAWQANNIRGQSTRAVATALQIAFGAIGGIFASTTFRQEEIPRYPTGLWATTATQIFTVAAAIGMTIFHYMANKRADRLKIGVEGLDTFRYTY